MKKICFVATIPAVVHTFLRAHIEVASDRYLITVICNNTDIHLLDGIRARIKVIPIRRKPSPFYDFITLFYLVKIFLHERFDIVHTHMPKTGLLGMMAAFFSFVPIRIHTFHGEVWATRRGWRRIVLKLFDHLVVFFATDILLVSPSQRQFLISEGILRLDKGKIIGSGSVCGVDHLRFHPDLVSRKDVREKLGIKHAAKVIIYLGRLNKDKGLLELAVAFESIAKINSDVVLLIVGSEEDVSISSIHDACGTACDRLHYVKFTTSPEKYMAAADIFCLPSYREGFGMSIIEAAACGLPTVASRIYGITDAVAEGQTGLLFPVGDVASLVQNLLDLIENNELRRQLGDLAYLRALKFFDSKQITREMINFYTELLQNR